MQGADADAPRCAAGQTQSCTGGLNADRHGCWFGDAPRGNREADRRARAWEPASDLVHMSGDDRRSRGAQSKLPDSRDFAWAVMPTAPLRPCSVCGHLGCQAHKRPAWGHAQPVKRIRGRRLQQRRKALFDRDPLCARCRLQGRVTLATIRDHVVPLAEGGKDDETNEQGLCQSCSDAKTAEESKRGQQRAR